VTLKQAFSHAREILIASNIEDAILEGELLLRHTLKISRVQLYLDLDYELTSKEELRKETVIQLLKRIKELSNNEDGHITYEDCYYFEKYKMREIKNIIEIIEENVVKEKKEFYFFAEKFKKETFNISSFKEIYKNEHYQKIIKMGKKILPYIFEDMQYNNNNNNNVLWYRAIEKITRKKIDIPNDIKGDISDINQYCLKWGRKKQYIK